MLAVLLFVGALLCVVNSARAEAPRDPRMRSVVLRTPSGQIARDGTVLREFRGLWACPATGKHDGACPGWAIDHVIPLACGGADALANLQWLPTAIKSGAGEWNKDRWERRVYGGNAMSKGCP